MFSNVAFSAVAFIVALGILISIHEYGHFWVARKVGIKVLRYSIGFGKPLLRRTGKIDNTEFVLAAIPLGGYVKMLDEREGNVADHEKHRAFNRQPLWARSAVVIAGPLANFLLAIVAYWIVMLIGISGVAPLLGAPEADSPAERAGFVYEDRIVSVNGQLTQTWTDARIALLDSSLGASNGESTLLRIEVERADGQSVTRELPITEEQMLKSDGDAVRNLGFRTWWPEVEPIVGELVADGAAAQAGLQVGDTITRVDGQNIDTWRELVASVQPRPDETLEILVSRGGQEIPLSLTPKSVQVGEQSVGQIGIRETQSQTMTNKARVTVQYPPMQALGQALQRTWDMSVLTVRMLGKLVVGQASLDNISGPISIAQFAGQSASIGIDHYINFIALISISLAVLNLLPIPMLDGGHLMYFAAEAVRGKPVSERVQIWGQQLGIVLLGGLMFLAFYNDILRVAS